MSSAAAQPLVAAAESDAPSAAAASAAAAAPAAAASESASAGAPAAAASESTSAGAPAAIGHGKSLETRAVMLTGDQVAYLSLMKDRYAIASVDKAARCLVNYARDGDQRHIFATIRCRKCGVRFPKQTRELTLYAHQWTFLERMKEEYKVSDPDESGKALRVLLDFTQEGRTKRGQTDAEKASILDALEKDIFTKVRCNDPVCTHQH